MPSEREPNFKKLDYSSAKERPTGNFEKTLKEDKELGPFKIINLRVNPKLPSIIIRNPESRFPTQFLLDSGSEVTILKSDTLPPNARINSEKRIAVKGIAPAPVKTEGILRIDILTTLWTLT